MAITPGKEKAGKLVSGPLRTATVLHLRSIAHSLMSGMEIMIPAQFTSRIIIKTTYEVDVL